jgi:hypothetical protein
MSLSTKTFLINGPNNVIRLEKGKKVLYIFGDYHLSTDQQNECMYDKKYESMDIDKFISLFMRTNKDVKLDLFTEMYSYELTPSLQNYRNRYIDSIVQLFQKRLIKNKDEIKINPDYANIRFHYMDIRYHILFFNTIFYYIDNHIYNSKIHNYYNYKVIFTELKEILKLSFNTIKNRENKYINKILEKYSNPEIKKKINKVYNEIYIKNINNIFILIDKILNFIKPDLTNEKIDKLKVMIDEIDYISKNSFTFLTDLYFIRRFLDKNYITNTILYTGSAHMVNITYILIKYFDFKITNAYYPPKKYNFNNIKKLKTDNFKYIDELLNDFTNRLPSGDPYQCVNLFDFPDNFS